MGCRRCGKNRKLRATTQLCSPCQAWVNWQTRPPSPCSRCGKLEPPFVVKTGLCKSCYHVLRRNPDASRHGSETHRQRLSEAQAAGPNRREKSGKWNGGRFVDGGGYVRVLPPDDYQGPRIHGGRYVYEHRLVAERLLGRLLKPGEVVHHKNHDRSDNREENLQVLASVSEHRRVHVAEARSLGPSRSAANAEPPTPDR